MDQDLNLVSKVKTDDKFPTRVPAFGKKQDLYLELACCHIHNCLCLGHS